MVSIDLSVQQLLKLKESAKEFAGFGASLNCKIKMKVDRCGNLVSHLLVRHSSPGLIDIFRKMLGYFLLSFSSSTLNVMKIDII